MINETSNVYSGDDEGFESAPEKVDTYLLKFMSNYLFIIIFKPLIA